MTGYQLFYVVYSHTYLNCNGSSFLLWVHTNGFYLFFNQLLCSSEDNVMIKQGLLNTSRTNKKVLTKRFNLSRKVFCTNKLISSKNILS